MLCEKIYSKSHGTKHRAFALSGIYCNIKNDHTHTQTHRCLIWLCGCRLWGCRGQREGIGISTVFGVQQLISLD